jgi:hypothetical protein
VSRASRLPRATEGGKSAPAACGVSLGVR